MVHLLLVLKPSIPFTHTDKINSLLCLFNKIWSKIICKEQKLCFTTVLISLEQKLHDNDRRIRYNRPLIFTGDYFQDPWWVPNCVDVPKSLYKIFAYILQYLYKCMAYVQKITLVYYLYITDVHISHL